MTNGRASQLAYAAVDGYAFPLGQEMPVPDGPMRDTAVTGVVTYAPGAPLTKSIASALQFCQVDVDPAFLNDRLHRMREIWVCFKVLRLHARDGRSGFVGKVQSSTTRLAASNRQRAAAIAPRDIVCRLFLAFSPVGGGSCGGLMTAVATWWLASRPRDGRLDHVRPSADWPDRAASIAS
jgi:hypothetical protein